MRLTDGKIELRPIAGTRPRGATPEADRALAVLALLIWRWSPLLLSTLNPDMSRASGVDPDREELVLTLCLALVVAVAIKVVGALLIGAMLIIPAAAARPQARTPEGMAVLAVLIGAFSVLGGLAMAFRFDTPAGPTIVCVSALLFAVSVLAARLRVALTG